MHRGGGDDNGLFSSGTSCNRRGANRPGGVLTRKPADNNLQGKKRF